MSTRIAALGGHRSNILQVLRTERVAQRGVMKNGKRATGSRRASMPCSTSRRRSSKAWRSDPRFTRPDGLFAPSKTQR
jgi:hypothetical protein